MSANGPQLGHSSQTAPINEYRVMWTQQKKQKLKKWHDGTLRFHTFNNRMLLYDEGKALITDKYLKPGVTIDEGDEVEFEQHLATIEEFVQTVIQDLTPVFAPQVERQQQRASVAAQKGMSPARAPAQRMNAPTPASKPSVPTPRRPGPPTPIRSLQTPQTPRTHPLIGADAQHAQSVQRRPIETLASAHRVSASLPPLQNHPLHQLPSSPIRHPPMPSARYAARSALQHAPRQQLHPPPFRPPESGHGPAPVRHQPPPCPRFPAPNPPLQLEPRQLSAPRVQVEASQVEMSPKAAQPNLPRPPSRPRFLPPQSARLQLDAISTLVPPPDPPSRKRPTPSEPALRPPIFRSNPPPQNERRIPTALPEPPMPPPQAQASTTPEPATIRLPDPYKKRNKLHCPPRRLTAENAPKPPELAPPPPRNHAQNPSPPQREEAPPPRKKARTSTTAPECVEVGSEPDSDPFEPMFSPHYHNPELPARPRPQFQSARTVLQVPPGSERVFVARKPAPPNLLPERQDARKTYDDSRPWSCEAGDLFERRPGTRRG